MYSTLVTTVLILLYARLSVATLDESLFKRALSIATSATLPKGWSSIGCYLDTGNPRTLESAATAGSTVTEESCVTYCNGLGYIFAGVEYSDECYCGNTFTTNTSEPITDCNMPCAGNATEACGAGNRLNIFWSGVAPPPPPSTNPGPPGWKLQGCYIDNANGRILTTGMAVPGGGSNMSVALCTSACHTAGYIYAGVEYAQECYCGNAIVNGGVIDTNGLSDCNMLCAGNSSEYCGAGNRLDVYELRSAIGSSSSASAQVGSSTSTVASTAASTTSATPSPTGPVHVPSAGGKRWIGCYTEATNGRALNQATDVNYNTMTVEICAAFCASYTMFGVEYSGECYCGNTLQAGSVLANTGDCAMLCDGNQTEYCGGPNRLDTYSGSPVTVSSASSGVSSTGTAASTGVSTAASTTSATTTPTGPIHVPSAGGKRWIGCYTEATNGRALNSASDVNYNTMTVEICAAYCASYTMFGVEYSGECYCGNTLQAGSVLANTGDCAMLCDGNQTEYCGGPNRLDLYSGSAVTSTAGSGGSSSTTASSPTSIGTSTATGLPAGWKYDGCYIDNVDGRIIMNQQPDNPALTVESCVNTCASAGYSVAGMEYSVQCFCGNAVINGGVLSATQTDCNMACGGNANEMCGAGNRMSVYSNGALQTIGVPTTATTGLPGSWQYSGCISDNVNQVRTLFWQIILTNNNSAQNCLGLCSQFGYNAAGMEYGEECYCGDISYVEAGASAPLPAADCGTVCSGNATEICGGGNALSYYTWTSPPVYTWHTPTGPDAGEYVFLIGGVVVPLITIAGINGKVSFVEKFGTSENASSTGAYELDLAEINNFTAAWRTMHVKTDVFCSAGLVLPDKVGRQITVGGWAEESVFGIRLYWPDGSPGVPGTNDWQENVDELALQVARWYPSAMIMANGSILVVGGEVGSNSAASPSLELLPKVGGTVYLDFLQRTDPNNLYPYLAVLPSGGIFIAYYNEARILDEVTFETVRTLPNIPGSVNNFLAGRTYPLEGTAMLLPQYAPYTAPLGVLICGGSSTGAALAIDNCVSIQPEVEGSEWVLERMPSQRVMTCITALPDGTYLILNGAQGGTAGFGLGRDPNLQAVLYDPTQPVNSRMSLMATTIVARLYHSEAILLQDGRVLVSGSDPQDGVHPEEYRVEVFLPPYLLKGATQPSLTVPVTDWAYGGTYTVTISLPTGNVAGARFSLMGAVASTHGNSMGQRTFFPAFSCSGNTCTITAPPNSHVCPPGWFQVFLLDGPTPSHSTWVRIGGDPGALGNWPNFPDFTIPGV